MSERDHMRKIFGFHPPTNYFKGEPPPAPPPPPNDHYEPWGAWVFFYGKYR